MAAMEAQVTKGIALHRFGLGSTGNGAEQIMFAEAHVPNQADEARLYCTVARRSVPPGPVVSDTGSAGAEDTEWRICPEPIWVSVCDSGGRRHLHIGRQEHSRQGPSSANVAASR